MERRGLTRPQMAARIAQEFEEDWIVNLGIGITTLCSNFAHDVIFHAENGVIGYGAVKPEGEEDIHLVNAGGQHSVPPIVQRMVPLFGPETSVVTAQNGIPWWYFHKLAGPCEDRRLESADPGGALRCRVGGLVGFDPRR